MKCDESKPACVRCTSTGRKCDGYQVTSPEDPSSSTSTTLSPPGPDAAISASALPILSNPYSGLEGSEQERRNFHFFCTRTVPQLSGFFGSEFWERLVPRTTYHHPAIKHAVLALSSLHERFELGDTSVFASNLDIAQGGFALQQYNKAIQQLIGATSRQQLDICLISCVLFACFEVRNTGPCVELATFCKRH